MGLELANGSIDRRLEKWPLLKNGGGGGEWYMGMGNGRQAPCVAAFSLHGKSTVEIQVEST